MTDAAAARPHLVRRLYDWVLSWADSPYGEAALAVLAFAESSFFPIPPDVLLMALAVSRPARALRYAFTCSVFSVLGGIAGYYIGYFLYDRLGRPVIEFYHLEQTYERVGGMYEAHAFVSILVAAFTPIPYKVFTIAAGAFHEHVSLGTLVLASAIGRPARFFLVGGLFYFFGAPIRAFIEKYFEWLTVAFTVLLVGGFLVIKYAIR